MSAIRFCGSQTLGELGISHAIDSGARSRQEDTIQVKWLASKSLSEHMATMRQAYTAADEATQDFDDAGSTSTTAVLTPDNKLGLGWVGDSPAMVVAKNNETDQYEFQRLFIPTTHEPDPELGRYDESLAFTFKENAFQFNDGRIIELNPYTKKWMIMADMGYTPLVTCFGYSHDPILAADPQFAEEINLNSIFPTEEYSNRALLLGSDGFENMAQNLFDPDETPEDFDEILTRFFNGPYKTILDEGYTNPDIAQQLIPHILETYENQPPSPNDPDIRPRADNISLAYVPLDGKTQRTGDIFIQIADGNSSSRAYQGADVSEVVCTTIANHF